MTTNLYFVGKSWTLQVSDEESIIFGYATNAVSAWTYTYDLLDAYRVFPWENFDEKVPKTVLKKLFRMMRKFVKENKVAC